MRVIHKNLQPFKDEYQRNGCVKLPSFLNPLILDLLKNGFSGEAEKRFILNDSSTEYTFCDHRLVTKLNIIFNDPEFLTAISDLIGKKVNFTKQRLYYIDPDCISLPWHDDSYGKDTRVAAMRFELSDGPYEGGDFLFRSKAGEFQFCKLNFSESVIFKIDIGDADHMVTAVTSGIRKSLAMFLCE
jgi:hypothetical protein